MHPHEAPQLTDTSAAAERILVERLRALSPSQKLELVRAQNRSLIRLSIAGIRARRGDVGDRELALRVAALRLPRETMVRLFGWDPEREGY